MFIKLTRLNGQPIWLNASFIVTVEPRNGGGSIVVPIGDGLDYDVKEKTEDVLRMLDGAPEPAVVPVPAPDMLAPTPEDVSPEPETPAVANEEPEEVKPAKRPAKAKTAAKRTRKSAKTKAEPATESVSADEPVAVAISDEQIERLKRMAPGSVRKLANTLTSQFRLDSADAAIAELVSRGVIAVDREHVDWK